MILCKTFPAVRVPKLRTRDRVGAIGRSRLDAASPRRETRWFSNAGKWSGVDRAERPRRKERERERKSVDRRGRRVANSGTAEARPEVSRRRVSRIESRFPCGVEWRTADGSDVASSSVWLREAAHVTCAAILSSQEFASVRCLGHSSSAARPRHSRAPRESLPLSLSLLCVTRVSHHPHIHARTRPTTHQRCLDSRIPWRSPRIS